MHLTIRNRVPYNKLLTNLACSSRTVEYWPSVVFVRTSLRSVRTATTSGQYSPVRPSRSVSKRLLFTSPSGDSCILYQLSKKFTEGNMRKVSSSFLLLHLCDVIQFRDDHVRMRIRGPLAPRACLKFWQHDKLFWALMSYLKAIFEILGHIFGEKLQKMENLPYGWLTHWKWATMVAKIRPVRVTRGGWCCARLTRRFFKACAIARFQNQFARGQKTIGSHLHPQPGNRGQEVGCNPEDVLARVITWTHLQMLFPFQSY